ncbi:MAG: carboxypeptidase regulatory-like domain-containing protein [Planctomycetes bacterium]|nr:carboxypeptidase regulatory-like domain-containing protein [Planctomycetota bacterium]
MGSRTVAPAVGQGAVADEVRVVRSSFYPILQGSSEQHEREPTQSRWAFELAVGTVQRVQLLVRADGFEPALVAFELAAGELRREVCVLQRLAVEISGVVCDERGRELAGLTLELRARSNVERERTTSDTDGRFSFPRTRKADAYALLVLDGDVLRASIEEGSLSLGMRVVVPTPARLSGQLLEPRGGLVGRARVQLSGSSENGTRTWFEPALLVEEGAFAFDPAPVGALELNVWREREPGTWLHLLSSPLTLAAGEARELDVVVPALP